MRPVARPIASSGAAQSRCTSAGFRPVRDGTDQPRPAVCRVSAGRLQQIADSLTAHDRAVVGFLAQVRLATGHQLARRLWSSQTPTDARARAARRTLRRLERWRVIARQGRRLGGVRGGSSSIVYGLGPTGRRLLIAEGFEPRRLREVGERALAHAVAVSELVVRLFEGDRDGTLELVGLETESTCWRGYLSPYGARQILKPDLRVTVGAGRLHTDAWWVEVDLATESAAAIARKAERYVAYWQTGEEQRRCGTFPRVIFTAPDRERAAKLQTALGRVGAPEQLFTVWLFEETIGRLAVEART